jgi:hypothetical protein
MLLRKAILHSPRFLFLLVVALFLATGAVTAQPKPASAGQCGVIYQCMQIELSSYTAWGAKIEGYVGSNDYITTSGCYYLPTVDNYINNTWWSGANLVSWYSTSNCSGSPFLTVQSCVGFLNCPWWYPGAPDWWQVCTDAGSDCWNGCYPGGEGCIVGGHSFP